MGVEIITVKKVTVIEKNNRNRVTGPIHVWQYRIYAVEACANFCVKEVSSFLRVYHFASFGCRNLQEFLRYETEYACILLEVA